MPAYSFSYLEFVPRILNGRKPHTIRPPRKRKTVPGDLLTLYYKQRTKDCRAICLTECVNVMPIRIHPHQWVVNLNGHVLSFEKVEALARRDGFESMHAFFKFFERYGEYTLKFELIKWDPEKMLDLWSVDLFQDLVRGLGSKGRREWLQYSLEVGNLLDKVGER